MSNLMFIMIFIYFKSRYSISKIFAVVQMSADFFYGYTSKTSNSDHSLIPISYSKFKIFIVRS